MPKILITGGAGFIGSNMVDHYVQKGWDVGIYDNFSTGRKDFCNPAAQIFEGDITNKKYLEEVVKTFEPSVVSHHAAHVSVRNSFEHPQFDAEKNILGSINIFDLAGKYNVEQIVFASTGGAMIEKNHKEFPAPVQVGNLDLDSPYALSKFCAEKYLRYFAKKHNYLATILRYGNVYGPRQTPKSEAGVISIFIQQLLSRKAPTIYGDGTQTRDFIYIDDVVSGHSVATEKKISGTYNISSASEISINQIHTILKGQLGNVDAKPIYDNLPFEELSRSCLDNRDFIHDSDWRPQWNFEEGIKKTIEWNKNQL